MISIHNKDRKKKVPIKVPIFIAICSILIYIASSFSSSFFNQEQLIGFTGGLIVLSIGLIEVERFEDQEEKVCGTLCTFGEISKLYELYINSEKKHPEAKQFLKDFKTYLERTEEDKIPITRKKEYIDRLISYFVAIESGNVKDSEKIMYLSLLDFTLDISWKNKAWGSITFKDLIKKKEDFAKKSHVIITMFIYNNEEQGLSEIISTHKEFGRVFRCEKSKAPLERKQSGMFIYLKENVQSMIEKEKNNSEHHEEWLLHVLKDENIDFEKCSVFIEDISSNEPYDGIEIRNIEEIKRCVDCYRRMITMSKKL